MPTSSAQRNDKVACIDVGTNSVLLLIAERSTQRAVVERATITRLGQGVDKERALQPEAVQRTLSCLENYATEIREQAVMDVRIVGTSALRDARGSAAFLARVQELLGTELEVISGVREAELTFAGALSGLDVHGPISVVDIGGGSTEFIFGQAALAGRSIQRALSVDMGSVRLLERHLPSDPPTPAECQALRDAVRALLAPVAPPDDVTPLVGVAGTVTTLAALALGMTTYDGARLHGATLTRSAVTALLRTFLELPLAKRRELPGLPKGRADAIVAGALIVDEILDWANCASLLVSDRGVRWGLVDEARR